MRNALLTGICPSFLQQIHRGIGLSLHLLASINTGLKLRGGYFQLKKKFWSCSSGFSKASVGSVTWELIKNTVAWALCQALLNRKLSKSSPGDSYTHISVRESGIQGPEPAKVRMTPPYSAHPRTGKVTANFRYPLL